MNLPDEDIMEKTGLQNALDRVRPASTFGCSLLSRIKPMRDFKMLTDEYDNVEKCLDIVNDAGRYDRFAGILRRFRDVRNTFARCAENKTLDDVELFEIKSFVCLSSELAAMENPSLAGVVFTDLSDVATLLDPAGTGTSSFYIYDEYSPKLAQIRARKRKTERDVYSVFGEDRRKLLEKRALLVHEEESEEFVIRERLTSRLSGYANRLSEMAQSVARFDLALAKAKLASDFGMCRPVLCEECRVSIKKGFSPAVKESVEGRGNRFFPVSFEANQGATVITGANMGGKTVALSVVALNYLLACMGFFAFAEKLEFKPMDFFCFLSDNAGSFENGLSTFGTEVMHLKNVLKALSEESGLVIIDEFARGTNPAEGSSLVKALVKYLNTRDAVSILSTHYDGVSRLADAHYQVRGLKGINLAAAGAVSRGNYASLLAGLMDYTLEKTDGDDVPRDAFNICSFFGIENEILLSAQEFLDPEPLRGQTCEKSGGNHGKQIES